MWACAHEPQAAHIRCFNSAALHTTRLHMSSTGIIVTLPLL